MKKLKPWLVLALVFLAGATFGVVATRVAVRHFVQRVITRPEMLRERIEADLTRRLRLDSAQRAKMHASLVRAHERMKELRQDFQPRLEVILGDAREEISMVLKPDQREKFEKFREENHHLLPGGKAD
jgi:hypothetical protein